MIRLAKNRLVISSQLNCSGESAWLLLTDTRLWVRWGPSISAVRCDHRFIAANSTGSVLTVFRFWLPFQITEYNEFTFWKWNVGGLGATGHRVTRLGENRCTLSFDMGWWCFPYLAVCAIALGRLQDMAAKGDWD